MRTAIDIKTLVKIAQKLALNVLALALLACGSAASAQESLYDRFRAQNAAMTAVQPTWMAPLIQGDSRLGQALRMSFSNSYTPARTQTVSYGNYHFLSLLAGNRVQFNLTSPPFIQNHTRGVRDGFADTMVEMKFRLASGNAEHGNFTLTPMVNFSAPTGSHQNGAASSVWYPMLGSGRAWGRFDVQMVLGGSLPAGKIAAQGRSVSWDTTAQWRALPRLWIDLENNATFNYGGPFDGKTQNFLTPAAFYMVRSKQWKPRHVIPVLGGGMQIATSGFHLYNHNLIAEMRVLF